MNTDHSTVNSKADIETRFDYHAPDSARIIAHEQTRSICKIVALEFDADLPPCREKSLALTKLEEAMFWANAAIARNPSDPAIVRKFDGQIARTIPQPPACVVPGCTSPHTKLP